MACRPPPQTNSYFERLAVEDFDRYELIIDARTPREFEEDHITGSANLPVVNDDEFAEVGTLHARDPHAAYVVGASYALRNIANHVRTRIASLGRDARILVYCFRGGKRSRVWADTLRTIGYRTDIVKGGWKAYRACVREGLEIVPKDFEFRVLSGLTGCGKTRLLHALGSIGEQALDLEGLAAHRGSIIGSLPHLPQPSQKLFDSLIFHELSSFTPDKPVWIEAESKRIGRLQLPEALVTAIRTGSQIEVVADMPARVSLLREDYPHFAADPMSMVSRLAPLKPLVGGEEMTLWAHLASKGQVDELFERVMCSHYDPSYRRSNQKSTGPRPIAADVRLVPTDNEFVRQAARRLVEHVGR